MDKLRVFTAFSGYDSQCMALDRLARDFPEFSYELVGWSEIDPYAIQAHDALYPQWADRNYGDISKIDWSQVPDFDLFTYSFPCFVAGTLVLTTSGYKSIEDVSEGDLVLTHTNTFQRVLKTMSRLYDGELLRINAMGFDSMVCTMEHPFYVRTRRRVYNKELRNKERVFDAPCWKKASELSKDTYLGYAINKECSLPQWGGTIDNRWGHNRSSNVLSSLFTNSSFWYIMGRYVGDGWKRSDRSGIVICCGGRNEDTLLAAFDAVGFSYTIAKERTVTKYHIAIKELYEFVERYGYYAHGKHIDVETMNLPKDLLSSFIDGYIESDGFQDGSLCKISSVSRDLIYGIAQCVAKVYDRPFSIYRTPRKATTVIEGRVVNQRDSYTITFKKERGVQDKAFYEDGYIWFPINKLDVFTSVVGVYNLEVEKDNSYTANGAIVHNCTDISNSGRQEGLAEDSGTRSSLLWECRKAIIAKRPKFLLMENVKALVSKKFLPQFNKWRSELSGYGYANFAQVLNAKDYGVPQNRERVFMVSILRSDDCSHPSYHFPYPFPLELRLKDMLERKVDESYYLSDDALKGLVFEDDAMSLTESKGGDNPTSR